MLALTRRAGRAIALASLGALLAACGGGADDPAPPPPPEFPAGTQACGDMDALRAAINTARSQARVCVSGGQAMPAVAPLNWNAALAAAARRHSIDMAQSDHVSHTGTDGSTAGQRIRDAGYDAAASGENIAAGYGSVDAVMAGWLASAGHCQNIMSASYADLGASCVSRSGSRYGSYWTTDFGRAAR